MKPLFKTTADPLVILVREADGTVKETRDCCRQHYCLGEDAWPEWLAEAVAGGVVSFMERCMLISTLEGVMPGNVGDWIIRGVKGEIYPCKPVEGEE